MHMPLARSALGRGMQRVAGMLTAKAGFYEKPAQEMKSKGFQLVSWASEARSRREDELARHREAETGQQAIASPAEG